MQHPCRLQGGNSTLCEACPTTQTCNNNSTLCEACERVDNLVYYSTTNNALGQATGTSRRLRASRCIGCIKGLSWDTVNGHAVRQLRYLVNYCPCELDYTNTSYLRWIPHDLGSNRFNCESSQLGVLAKWSSMGSNAYPFVRVWAEGSSSVHSLWSSSTLTEALSSIAMMLETPLGGLEYSNIISATVVDKCWSTNWWLLICERVDNLVSYSTIPITL